MNLTDLKPMDRIIVSKRDLPFVKHHALYYGVHFGVRTYIENSESHGVRLISERELLANRIGEIGIILFEKNDAERKKAFELATRLIGIKYYLGKFNCEHFCNYIQKGDSYSDQVNTTLLLTIFGIAIYKLSKAS